MALVGNKNELVFRCSDVEKCAVKENKEQLAKQQQQNEPQNTPNRSSNNDDINNNTPLPKNGSLAAKH